MSIKDRGWYFKNAFVKIDPDYLGHILDFCISKGAVEIHVGNQGNKGTRANFCFKNKYGETYSYYGRVNPKDNFRLRDQPFNPRHLSQIWSTAEKQAIFNPEIGTLYDLDVDTTHHSSHPGPVPYFGAKKGVEAQGTYPAYTYAFRFGKTSSFKIGHTKNIKTRLANFNRHIPTELKGQDCWVRAYKQYWQSATDAQNMEQYLLKLIGRTKYERVNCDPEVLEDAWKNYLKSKNLIVEDL